MIRICSKNRFITISLQEENTNIQAKTFKKNYIIH